MGITKESDNTSSSNSRLNRHNLCENLSMFESSACSVNSRRLYRVTRINALLTSAL